MMNLRKLLRDDPDVTTLLREIIIRFFPQRLKRLALWVRDPIKIVRVIQSLDSTTQEEIKKFLFEINSIQSDVESLEIIERDSYKREAVRLALLGEGFSLYKLKPDKRSRRNGQKDK